MRREQSPNAMAQRTSFRPVDAPLQGSSRRCAGCAPRGCACDEAARQLLARELMAPSTTMWRGPACTHKAAWTSCSEHPMSRGASGPSLTSRPRRPSSGPARWTRPQLLGAARFVAQGLQLGGLGSRAPLAAQELDRCFVRNAGPPRSRLWAADAGPPAGQPLEEADGFPVSALFGQHGEQRARRRILERADRLSPRRMRR